MRTPTWRLCVLSLALGAGLAACSSAKDAAADGAPPGEGGAGGAQNIAGQPGQGGAGAGGELGAVAGTGGRAGGPPAGASGTAGRVEAAGGRGAAGAPGEGGHTGGTAGGGAAGHGPGPGGRGGGAGMGATAGNSGTPTIFYLDVSGKVMTADAENPKPKTLVASAGQGPDGIAVDLAGGYVYWTDMGVPADNDGTIMRSNLDGSHVVTIVPKAGTWTPKQMKLEPISGKLYWSDREGMRVMRANVDGSNIETLVTVATGDTARMDGKNHCVGMALDTAGGWFYWTQKGVTDTGTDLGHGSIRRAHIQMPSGQDSTNRTDIEVLYDKLPEPIDLDLDVESGTLYWADRGDNTISRGPIAPAAREIIVSDVSQAIGVAIDKPRNRLYYTAAKGQLGRANLDGSNKQELTGQGAMTGIVIVTLP
jgi:hypothetical protein